MARSPSDLLKLTPEDETAVKALEDYIDNSPEFASFDGYEIKIPIPEKLYDQCLNIRKSTRTQALCSRFHAVGWKEVSFHGTGRQLSLCLNQYEKSYGSGRD